MSLLWNKNLEVGVDLIDSQNKKWFEKALGTNLEIIFKGMPPLSYKYLVSVCKMNCIMELLLYLLLNYA